MASFTQELWQSNIDVYKKIQQHPFNQELARGTLDKNLFQEYVIQDAHYLVAYGRALAVAGAKAFNVDDIIFFAQAAQEAIVVERILHNEFMQKFEISREQFQATPLSLACHHYTSFLLATAWSESYPVVLASLLPCFWIYAEVGKDIVDLSSKDNPYQPWIDTYSGEDFNASVARIISIIDKVAEEVDDSTREKMREVYNKGVHLEWLFWDNVYQQRNWLAVEN